jgi:nucleoside-diphosphate-sugar epimerase
VRTAAAAEALSRRGVRPVLFEASRPATWGPLLTAAAVLGHGYRLLCSIPPVELEGGGDATAALLAALPVASRLVYLSSTGVYGDARRVDETTPTSPRTPAHHRRLEAERSVAGCASHLILRAAAIYGPDRGVHVAGPRQRSIDPDRVVSRIHVEDLAALCDAALESSVTGAFPVADLAPASAREVVAFCVAAGLAPEPLPESGPAGSLAGRWVDGRAAFERLGVRIAYPSFREGVWP